MDKYEDLKQSLIQEKNAISSELPWLIAIKLHNAPDLEGYDMIVANSEDFIWEDGDGNEITFKLFPFNISGLSFTSSGKFPDVTLNLFNTATIAKYAEEHNCFLGLDITVYFINIRACSEYNSETYPLQFTFTVADGTIAKYIVLKLRSPNYLTRLIPAVRYYRDFCPYEYRQEFCWMKDVDISHILPQDLLCDKSFETCVKYKDTYERFLPNGETRGIRYGGFPNLSKGNTYYY